MMSWNRYGMMMLMGTLVAGCGAPAQSQRGALNAGADAQRYGVQAYVVEAGRTVLLDSYGVELGQLTVTAPDAEHRMIDFAMVDGSTDDVEVYRPLKGQFLAPISPISLATAVLADRALAPMLAEHAIVFSVLDEARLQPVAEVQPEIIATTTACTSPTSDSPNGCARPANTAIGCTNPSQLPATLTSTTWTDDPPCTYTDGGLGVCAKNSSECAIYCADLGKKVHTYVFGSCVCGIQNTGNRWDASCPPSTCSSPNYDAVPRLRACADPGSCTKSQGSIYCTSYH